MKQYLKIVKNNTPKEERLKNSIIAFLTGGVMGIMFTLVTNLIRSSFHVSINSAISWSLIIFIFSSCLCTGLGFFDILVGKLKCGLIIPITGFAHSVCSAVLDYRKDGMICGIGSNIFKLAGSVLLYGIFFAFIFALIKGIFIYG